ncbi:hypothetical protein KL921_005259 [Ogataea angusta]|uniref:C2H2-type domain-containing protein n=1 Tax=Pichia angusta TaxID=870730 RepID=A0AAN6I604_PICAN|nr:uncharacterized protein KL928_001464 [Ogataea angusta]KAG7805828.1 hypothetical protein KL921_005259 [Ogataea angusta]KAG7817079.1 hypothetical protein KL909_005328 [Ogataea angusta]KAG7820027.1 hypothetical protein KL928_001464 [Ogataea angusta]KAG7829401.1 hypothetical protein KL920_002260 [Ogataea angusta]KAG7835400.1 hypothetical protein KL942_005339 [Ogataea angusta]
MQPSGSEEKYKIQRSRDMNQSHLSPNLMRSPYQSAGNLSPPDQDQASEQARETGPVTHMPQIWQLYDNYTTDMILGDYDSSPGTYLASSQQPELQYVANSPATKNMYSTEHRVSINSIPSLDGKKQPTFASTDPTALKKFRCSQCTSSFTRRSRLKEHCRKVHEGEKLVFRCDHCDKVMSSRENLNRHMIGHTDKYRCPYCGKRHDRSDRFQRHIQKCSARHNSV